MSIQRTEFIIGSVAMGMDNSRNYNLFFGSQIWWQALLVALFIAFRLILVRNMGSDGWNEIDVLPLAKHFVDPSWVPNDWYLDRPAGYR